jgi:hypothetical protein
LLYGNRYWLSDRPMRWLFVLLLAGCAMPPDKVPEKVAVPEVSAADFSACAACHLDNGDGVPGAFPRLRNRGAAMAQLEGGRNYLMTVVTYGVMGTIEVDGLSFSGVMPGHGQSLDSARIAGALNFLVYELTDSDATATGLTPFSAKEVDEFQSKNSDGNLGSAFRVREQLLAQHGDKWPQ